MLSIYHSWDVLMMAEGQWKQSWSSQQWQPQKGGRGGRGGGKGVKAPWAAKPKTGSRKGTLAHH